MSRSKNMPISIRWPARDATAIAQELYKRSASLTEAEQQLVNRRNQSRAELVNKVDDFIEGHYRKGGRRIRKSEVKGIRQFAVRKFDRSQEQFCREVRKALKNLHSKG